MLLSIDSLVFTYPLSRKAALTDITLEIGSNEYVAVIGANGSGKSTLARCVAGLLQPNSGSIRIDTGHRSQDRVPSGLVFQSPADQIVAETVELDIAFGPENLGLSRDVMSARVLRAIDGFGLHSLAASATHELSSGQKQHLAMAGVTVLDPALLLLDEPTSMLSPLARKSLLSFLDRFHAEGGTILHITHDLTEASRAGRVIVLDAGRMVFDETPAAMNALSAVTLEKWGLHGVPVPAATHAPAAATAKPATASPILLECRSLSFGPIRDFSLSLEEGTITAITGESGSGKTVLLELLTGLRAPEAGQVMLADGHRVSLAVQESEASLFAEFVADDVAFGPRNAGLSGSGLLRRVTDALNLVGLPFAEFADRRTFSLSGGERRKAALAGIIAMDTSVILLDEPSSALDTRSRSQLLHLILALKAAGKTVAFTTNRTEECVIADKVIALPLPETVPAAGRRPVVSVGAKKRTRDQISLDRLRRGASGSYAKLDTPVHRWAPLTKYLLAASSIAAALAVSGWKWLLLLIALECVPVALARYSFKKLGVSILKILPWLVFLGVLQYLILPDVMQSVVFLLRFIALLIPLTVFVFVTAHTEIMYGMEDFLFPLRLFRIPVRDVSLVTGIVFRFITLLYEEAARITTARIIRGAGSGRKKGLVATVSSMASLFVPLVLRTLTRAERLSEAITARYYGTGKNSRYLYWKIEFAQRILIVAVPLFSGMLILLSVLFRK